jgi:chromosome segregation ATPase
MAARKKPASKTPTPPLDAPSLVVILEDMRSQFTVFGEALQISREESARHFEQIDSRFEQIDSRFDQIDHRLDQHEARFATLERATLENGRDIRELRRDVSEVRRDLGAVCSTVDRIENALAAKVNRDEVEAIIHRVVTRP